MTQILFLMGYLSSNSGFAEQLFSITTPSHENPNTGCAIRELKSSILRRECKIPGNSYFYHCINLNLNYPPYIKYSWFRLFYHPGFGISASGWK